MKKLTLLYAIPKGETERYMEDIISSQCETPEQIEAMKARASKDGWHSFRVAISDGSMPNFNNVVRKGIK